MRSAGRAELVLVAESDHFLPEFESSTHPYTFGPLTDYFTRPLNRLGLPFPYRLANTQHLGVVALGTYLRRHGFQVRAFDNVFRIPEAREGLLRALGEGPLAVGISTAFLMHPESVSRIVAWVRAKAPNALVVLGGFNAERNPLIREHGDVTVVEGGEETLLALMRALRQRRDWRGIGGLCYKDGGAFARTPGGRGPSLENLPPPDWDLLEHRPSLYYSIEASKGCRYTCAFCSYNDKGNQRMRPVERIMAEIRRDYELYGIRRLRFIDANLTSWPEHTEALCEAVASSGIPLEWSCFARIDDFVKRPSLAAAMRRSGCLWVFSGIESGSDRILAGMRKGYSASVIERGVRLAREAGLVVHGSFIIGFPGESEETIQETLALIRSSGVDTVVFTVLAVTEEMIEYARRHPERARGLRREGAVWSHDTMDYEAAKAQVERCIDAVAMGMERPLVTPYGVTLYYLMGSGFSMQEALASLEAFRDFYRGWRRADPALQESALGRIREDYLRFLGGFMGRVPPSEALPSRLLAHA